MNQRCQLNTKLFFLIYLLNNGLSSSVKNVTAFPLCPALPVRPKKNQIINKHFFGEKRPSRFTYKNGFFTALKN